MKKKLPLLVFFAVGCTATGAETGAGAQHVASPAALSSARPAEKGFRELQDTEAVSPATASANIAIPVLRSVATMQKTLVEARNEQVDATSIMGGEKTCTQMATSVGALLVNDELKCSTVRIGRRSVLTAAHCIKEDASTVYKVFFGCDIAEATDGDKLKIKSVHSNKNFLRADNRPDNDVAVLCLEAAPPGVGTARLPADSSADLRGAVLDFFGFGIAEPPLRVRVGVKRHVQMTVSDAQGATFSYGSRDKNTCNGDSGGPAFLGDTVVGLTSMGDDICRRFGVDVRLDRNLDFISEQMNICASD